MPRPLAGAFFSFTSRPKRHILDIPRRNGENSMREIFRTIRQRLPEEDLVLATVIASTGATPRGAGARMLAGKDGRICGTIGGGAVEFRSEAIAKQVLKDKTSLGHDFSLTRGDVENLGMICGGDCRVFFHYLPAGDAAALTLAEEAEERLQRGEDLWLISDMAAGGKLRLADRNDPLGPCLSRRPGICGEVYVEKIGSSGRVYIFGGGHLARELVPVLARVGFRCVVLEDREDFADARFFPEAEKCLLCDFDRISDSVTITGEDYVCIMTRGHASDTAVQAQVLPMGPCYCGVIGSRRKAAGVRKVLKEVYGLPEDLLDRVTTPIGLPIQAETPAEIAVSIAAQMIQVRAERGRM